MTSWLWSGYVTHVHDEHTGGGHDDKEEQERGGGWREIVLP